MSRALILREAGPALSVQDAGRPGYLAHGLSRGGAADRLALAEGAALLGQEPDLAAVEMSGLGGLFEATVDMRIALTGAPMKATLDGAPLRWNASHLLPAGAALRIGGAERGVYGYLHLGGGVRGPRVLGARGAHLAAGLGRVLAPGDRLEVGPDRGQETGLHLTAETRFEGGLIRVFPSLQTEFFSEGEIARFQATRFRRDARGNRMGVRILPDGAGFQTEAGLNILSEVIIPGDIQITGDGTPFVLLCECQTIGGYPRIGSVLPADLPRLAQAGPGAELRFAFTTEAEALAIARRAAAEEAALPARISPLVRDLHDIRDLLSYQLISGVTAGHPEESEEEP